MTPKELEDNGMREFIYDFIEKNGGIEKAKQESKKYEAKSVEMDSPPSRPPIENVPAAPPTLPSRNPSSVGRAPPPPPPRTPAPSAPRNHSPPPLPPQNKLNGRKFFVFVPELSKERRVNRDGENVGTYVRSPRHLNIMTSYLYKIVRNYITIFLKIFNSF